MRQGRAAEALEDLGEVSYREAREWSKYLRSN